MWECAGAACIPFHTLHLLEHARVLQLSLCGLQLQPSLGLLSACLSSLTAHCESFHGLGMLGVEVCDEPVHERRG